MKRAKTQTDFRTRTNEVVLDDLLKWEVQSKDSRYTSKIVAARLKGTKPIKQIIDNNRKINSSPHKYILCLRCQYKCDSHTDNALELLSHACHKALWVPKMLEHSAGIGVDIYMADDVKISMMGFFMDPECKELYSFATSTMDLSKWLTNTTMKPMTHPQDLLPSGLKQDKVGNVIL